MSRGRQWALVLLIVALCGVTAGAIVHAVRLTRALERAEGQVELSEIARLRAVGRPHEALALARVLASGARGEPTARRALAEAFVGLPPPTHVLVNEARIDTVALSSDGLTLAAVVGRDLLRVWDAVTGRRIGQARIDIDRFAAPCTFSPDGHHLTARVDGHPAIWSVPGFRRVTLGALATASFASFPERAGEVVVHSREGAFRHRLVDGERLGPALEGRTYETATGRVRLVLQRPTDESDMTASRTIRVVRDDETFVELLAVPRQIHGLALHGGWVIAGSGLRQEMLIWDATAGGEPVLRVQGANEFEVDREHRTMLLPARQGAPQMVTLDASPPRSFPLEGGAYARLATLADATTAIVAHDDGAIRRFTDRAVEVVVMLDGPASNLTASPARFAVSSERTIYLVDLAPGRPICLPPTRGSCPETEAARRPRPGRARDASIPPEFRGRIATLTDDGTITVRDVEGGGHVVRIRHRRAQSATLVRDGDRLVVEEERGVALYDADTGHAIGRPMTWRTDILHLAYPSVRVAENRQAVFVYVAGGEVSRVDLDTFVRRRIDGMGGATHMFDIEGAPYVAAVIASQPESPPRLAYLGVFDVARASPVTTFAPGLADAASAVLSPRGDALYVTANGEERRIPLFRSPREAVQATAPISNHRVCPGSRRVVVVAPEALRDPVWAPTSTCERAARR